MHSASILQCASADHTVSQTTHGAPLSRNMRKGSTPARGTRTGRAGSPCMLEQALLRGVFRRPNGDTVVCQSCLICYCRRGFGRNRCGISASHQSISGAGLDCTLLSWLGLACGRWRFVCCPVAAAGLVVVTFGIPLTAAAILYMWGNAKHQALSFSPSFSISSRLIRSHLSLTLCWRSRPIEQASLKPGLSMLVRYGYTLPRRAAMVSAMPSRPPAPLVANAWS